MPIYVGGQSADVWANQGLFELSAEGAPDVVSGVPPDAFSATGQLWGSPLYRWPAHAEEGYAWWADRMRRALALHDEVRIDHFRAFAGYWSVKVCLRFFVFVLFVCFVCLCVLYLFGCVCALHLKSTHT